MSINCKRSILMLCALLFGGTPAAMAQHVHGENQAPFDTHEYHDFQPFKPAQLSEYGNGPAPNEGWFFGYDRMHLHVSAPELSDVGDPNQEYQRFFPFGQYAGRPIPQAYENGASNAYLDSEAGYTNRYEFGWMVDDNGWMVGINSRLRQTQVNVLSGAAILFDDPNGLLNGYLNLDGDEFADDLDGDGIFGNDGIDTNFDNVPDAIFGPDLDDTVYIVPNYDQLKLRNLFEMSSAEAMKLWRFDVLHYGGVFEWGLGGRFLELDDTFYITGGVRDGFIGNAQAGGDLNVTNIKHKFDNHIVGPQLYMKWSRRTGRWTISTEGRVVAGINFRTARQEGEIATEFLTDQLNQDPLNPNFPIAVERNTFKNRYRDEQFSPIAEVRLDAKYQITNAFSIKFGWTGMFVDNVARASNTMVYRMPGMGIRSPGYGEDIIINGVNVGVEFNR